MDRRCGHTEPDPCSGLYDTDVLRAPQLQHSVQHVGRDGHVWTTAPVQGKNGRSATWSGAVMCPASTDAVRMAISTLSERSHHLVASRRRSTATTTKCGIRSLKVIMPVRM